MQPSVLSLGNRALTFADRTPREFEITALGSSDSDPEMINRNDMAIGAGPSYVRAFMGSGPTPAERERARKASSSILREDSITIEESEGPSRPDSFSMHFDCTNQAPYLTNPREEMITQRSLLYLPKGNASHDLAFFIKTSGPPAPHSRPSKILSSRRAVRLLRSAQSRLSRQGSKLRHEHDLDDDFGNFPLPPGVEQKVCLDGKKYLALKEPAEPLPITKRVEKDDEPQMISPSIVESDVWISFAENLNSPATLDECAQRLRGDRTRQPDSDVRNCSGYDRCDERAVSPERAECVSPIRPAASSPPTPEPVSPISASSYHDSPKEQRLTRFFDTTRALSSHPVAESPTSSSPPATTGLYEQLAVNHPLRGKDAEIRHPTPRRFASHPLLYQQISGNISPVYQQSVSDSPGSPPPRSPLRLRRDPRTIEKLVASHDALKAPPQRILSINEGRDYTVDRRTIRPTIITECSGPIKRPRSRGKKVNATPPLSRKERDERIRALKLRDRPVSTRKAIPHGLSASIRAVAPSPLREPAPRKPELWPSPLHLRTSSSTSSISSWKKVAGRPPTPIATALPSQGSAARHSEESVYAPVPPIAPERLAPKEPGLALSPVMLVAEQTPTCATKYPDKPSNSKMVARDGKVYFARPRSASMPRNALKRYSRQRPITPTQMNSPVSRESQDGSPALPSPPPTGPLPPTPPASGSEKAFKAKHPSSSENKKSLPVLPTYEINPKHTAHVISQADSKMLSDKDQTKVLKLQGRIEEFERVNAVQQASNKELEQRNRGLLTALDAAYKAHDELSATLGAPGYRLQQCPSGWENRVARRNAASRVTSTSNVCGLDLYLQARGGSVRTAVKEAESESEFCRNAS